MCAPTPLGLRRNLNSLHEIPHSRIFSARRALAIKSRQTIILPPIPQNIPQNQASHVEASLASTVTDLPVTTPPITALSPDRSVSIPGLSDDPGVNTLSTAPFVSTPAVVTLASSINLPSSKTVISSILGSATFSSVISTLSASSTYNIVTTITGTPVTTITPQTTTISVSQSSDSTVTTTSYTTSINSLKSTETDNYSTESFTLVPSSTVSDTSSSVVSSSTTNDTAPAKSSSPISVTPANLSAHNPSFYIGIILGTVGAIACLCALIAWFIRLRRHVRRRHASRSLNLPWVKPVDDSWGLESGHCSSSDVVAISAMHLGSREDLADVQAWSPRGDRDVGEPRRADSGNNGSTYSLQNHPIPEYCLFSDDSVRAFASSEGYSTASLLPHHNLRQLPSHLVDQELAARVSWEHASLRSNDNVDRMMDSPSRTHRDCGTPRERLNKPRFLSLRGNGLNVPWHLKPSGSRSIAERLRNHGKPAEPPWEQISPRQDLDETDKVPAEPWSASFKSSLVSAFNAVAANLSSAVGTPQMNGNGLSSAPSKRTARKSVRDTFWGENELKAKELELSRETSVSTMTSNAWTLEETREGAGIVHLHIPSIQVCGDEPATQRPHLTGPTLSFGDENDVISDCDDKNDGRRVVEHPQVPLIASEKPPPAVIRPDRNNHARRNNTKKPLKPFLSRAGSSNYSMTSKSGSVSIPSNPFNAKDNSDSVVIEPSQISRLSSFDSSATSSTTILDGTTGVIEALKDRRNRLGF